jgi:hypothetical protein
MSSPFLMPLRNTSTITAEQLWAANDFHYDVAEGMYIDVMKYVCVSISVYRYVFIYMCICIYLLRTIIDY